MSFFGRRYERELCEFGITFCAGKMDDVLVIAPKLMGRQIASDTFALYESSAEMVDYLYSDDQLVGVAYSLFSTFLFYYLNGQVPDDFPVALAADIALFPINDLRIQEAFSEEECRQIQEAHENARTLISPLQSFPPCIVKRLRQRISRYPLKTIH